MFMVGQSSSPINAVGRIVQVRASRSLCCQPTAGSDSCGWLMGLVLPPVFCVTVQGARANFALFNGGDPLSLQSYAQLVASGADVQCQPKQL